MPTDDTRSLSYAELADALGIKVPSARKLAQRKRWQRTLANDGTARVTVPVEALERPTDSPTPVTGDMPTDIPAPVPMDVMALQVAVARLEAELSAARQRVQDIEGDRDAWRAQAQQLALRPASRSLRQRLAQLLAA